MCKADAATRELVDVWCPVIVRTVAAHIADAQVIRENEDDVRAVRRCCPSGGEEGQQIYRKGRPPDFRVDSGEAYNVGQRNGGLDYKKAHPDAIVNVTLRCKADYDAVGEKMPAPKYKWIWDVAYRTPAQGSDVLHVFVDGMNGDYISKEVRKQ